MTREVSCTEEVNDGNDLSNVIGQAFKACSYEVYFILEMVAYFCLIWFAFLS